MKARSRLPPAPSPARRPGAGYFDLQPAPAEGPPDQRFNQPDSLYPARPDRFRGGLDKTRPQPDTVLRRDDRRAVLPVEPAPQRRNDTKGYGQERGNYP